MKYKDLHPNMTPIDSEEGGVIRGHATEPCCVCGHPTEYIEICSEAHFCSEECLNEFYDTFWQNIHEICEADEEVF